MIICHPNCKKCNLLFNKDPEIKQLLINNINNINEKIDITLYNIKNRHFNCKIGKKPEISENLFDLSKYKLYQCFHNLSNYYDKISNKYNKEERNIQKGIYIEIFIDDIDDSYLANELNYNITHIASDNY
jgi:hypothetical protein